MDGAQEFANKLNFIERELTALKTAHMHPLGSVIFYKKSTNLTFNAQFNKVIVSLAESSITPIVQIGFFSQNNLLEAGSNVVSDTQYEYYFKAFSDGITVSLDVVSNVEILSITRSNV